MLKVLVVLALAMFGFGLLVAVVAMTVAAIIWDDPVYLRYWLRKTVSFRTQFCEAAEEAKDLLKEMAVKMRERIEELEAC